MGHCHSERSEESDAVNRNETPDPSLVLRMTGGVEIPDPSPVLRMTTGRKSDLI